MICGMHLRTISQEVLMNLIHNMYAEITLLKGPPHLPGARESRHWTYDEYCEISKILDAPNPKT